LGNWWSAALPPARDAATVVFGSVLQDLEPDGRRNPAPDASLGAGGHVVDPAARETGEVIVRRRVSIEAHTARIGAFGQESLGGQHAEVAMDGREAHPRQPTSHALVDERGRRVGLGRADDVENQPARPRQPEPACAQRVEPEVID